MTGIRVWNEYDPVPYLAQLVGYQQTGVPVKLKLSNPAKDLFLQESINQISPIFNVAGPHILFQVLI